MFDSIVHSKLYSSLYIHCFTVNLYTNSQYSNNPPPHPFIPCIHYVPFPLHTWYKLYPHPFIPCIHFIIPASYLAYTIPPFIPCIHYTIPASYLAYTIPFPLHTLHTLYPHPLHTLHSLYPPSYLSYTIQPPILRELYLD